MFWCIVVDLLVLFTFCLFGFCLSLCFVLVNFVFTLLVCLLCLGLLCFGCLFFWFDDVVGFVRFAFDFGFGLFYCCLLSVFCWFMLVWIAFCFCWRIVLLVWMGIVDLTVGLFDLFDVDACFSGLGLTVLFIILVLLILVWIALLLTLFFGLLDCLCLFDWFGWFRFYDRLLFFVCIWDWSMRLFCWIRRLLVILMCLQIVLWFWFDWMFCVWDWFFVWFVLIIVLLGWFCLFGCWLIDLDWLYWLLTIAVVLFW